MASLADETLRTRPERREALLVQLAKLDRQIAKGTENLLLLAPADIRAASAMLADWRAQRDGLHPPPRETRTARRVPSRRERTGVALVLAVAR